MINQDNRRPVPVAGLNPYSHLVGKNHGNPQVTTITHIHQRRRQTDACSWKTDLERFYPPGNIIGQSRTRAEKQRHKHGFTVGPARKVVAKRRFKQPRLLAIQKIGCHTRGMQQ